MATDGLIEMNSSKFGISLAVPSFRKNRKWGDRIRETFRSQGKQWNDRIAGEVKSLIASNVASSPGNSLGPQGTSAFGALVASLESKLGEIEKSQQ